MRTEKSDLNNDSKISAAKKPSPFISFIYSVFAAQTVHPLALPLDTIDKRLQTSEYKIFKKGATSSSVFYDLKKIAFADAFNKSALEKFRSIYKGFWAGAFYKIPQRGLKFWGQPYIKNYLETNFGDQLNIKYNKKQKEVLLNTAGGIGMALFETGLLTPFDKWKVMNQVTNEKVSFLTVIKTKPYAGVLAIGLRNVTGNMSLFFGSSLIKEYGMNLDNAYNATFAQNLIASATAATIGVLLTNPSDTVKTRAQKMNGEMSSFSIFKQIIQKEDIRALWKGTGTRLITAGPQLALTMALIQSMPNIVEKARKR